MTISFKYNFSIRIDGAPVTTIDREYSVEAYDKIGVVIPANQSKSVKIQPTTEEINFMVLESNEYSTDTERIYYKIVGDPQTNNEIILYRPQFLVGEFIVKLFRIIPEELEFTNELPRDVTIDILIGRKVI